MGWKRVISREMRRIGIIMIYVSIFASRSFFFFSFFFSLEKTEVGI